MSENERFFVMSCDILSIDKITDREGEILELNHQACYRAIKSKDARFDGVFYMAVKTTGIYCRPVCKVPAPKTENCTFYSSAAEAEAAGFRPCLRCRPELAPAYSEFGQGKELFRMIIEYFEDHNYRPKIVGQCAEFLGISPRHLNRVFKEESGVSPKEYIMTKRLLRAKGLLADTNLSVTEIGSMAGFGSSSRFNAALKKHYKLTPSDIRKEYKKDRNRDAVSVKLFYRPPYDWNHIMKFFSARAIPGVEWLSENGYYRRTLRIKDGEISHLGWIEIKPVEDENRVDLKISKSLEKAVVQVIALVRKVFDLDVSPENMPDELSSEIRLPGCFDSFEMATRAVLGQQITVSAATTISGRIAESLGSQALTPWKEINRYFPEPSVFAEMGEEAYDILGKLGVIRSRTSSITAIARLIDSGQLTFNEDVEIFKSKLTDIKGIGQWTAEYLSMRGMSWPDAFPLTDIVIKNRMLEFLKDDDGTRLKERTDLSKYKLNKLYEKLAVEYAESYRPFRSYFTLALWRGDFKG